MRETAVLAVEWLKSYGIEEKQIVVWGHSLGGHPALYLATLYPNLQKVVLVNTLYSIQNHIWSFGFYSLFFQNILNSGAIAPFVTAKIVQYHDTFDQTLPYKNGRKLFEKIATKNKKFIDLKGGHATFVVADTFVE
jgi:pimeloyl-ACP methyl ester carboxylesterase